MTPSRALFCYCIAFLMGITIESFTFMPQLFVWGVLVGGLVLIVISFLGKKEMAVFGFCLLFLVLGILRLQVTEFTIANDKVAKFNDRPEKIALAGQIIDGPDVRDTSQKLKVKIDQTNSIVLVTVMRYPEYHYLDKVSLSGTLKTPMETEGFSYKNYLIKDGIYSVMDFPMVTLVPGETNHSFTTFLKEKIIQFKGKLQQSIYLNFSPPQSSIVEGIILGGTASMPSETRDRFRATGLSHLTAISGSNVVILSAILMSFLLFLGFWRGQAFYLSVVFIWFYIAIAGFPASGIRAAIMASIFLLAQKLGRQNTSSRVIVLTAALMLLENPLLLLHDIGFQLSFLAALGIIYAKPMIDYLFPFANYKKVKNLLDIFSITLAAQLFTLPIIAYHFRTVSVVAPITNLLVIPIIDWVMIFGFLVALLGLFSNVLAFLFSVPAWLLLAYFLKVLDLFAQPWATLMIPQFHWAWVALYYAILTFLVWRVRKRLELNFLGY